MNQPKGIYWLASYPKSGNTWFRIFLANLLHKSGDPWDLNDMHTGMIASTREWMDDALGFESAHLSHDELDKLRPDVYSGYAQTLETAAYHKIHDAYTYLDNHRPLIPTEGCLGALYFIRNPLDVAISFANHLSCTVDEAIDKMGNSHMAFCKSESRQYHQLRQKLLSWSEHVNSWVTAKNMNVLVLRYEDMKLNTHEVFNRAVQFLQLDVRPDEVEHALAQSHIDKLQAWEAQSGFRERPIKTERFFRKGIVGDWQTRLSDMQIERIVRDHKDVMREFGYVNKHDEPVEGDVL